MEKGNKTYHLLDRYLGIPAVLFFSLFKRRFVKRPVEIKKIAIVNLFSIGDNVLMSATIADLVSAYPDAELIAFTAKNNYNLVKLIPGFSEIIQIPLTRPFQAIRAIRSKGHFDIVLDYGSWPRISAIYSFFVPGKLKIGFRSPKQFRHHLFHKTVNYSSAIHEIDNYRSLIKDYYGEKHHLPFINYQQTLRVSMFRKEIKRYCVIHPWPGGYKSHLKQWDNANWVELIYRINDHFDTIILTGAPSDTEKCEALELMIDQTKLSAKFLNISGKYSLGETAYLLKNASFIVSIDTGIAHMSAAFQKPLICIQGPANSTRWRPYSKYTTVVNPDRGTYGFLSFGFEYYRAQGNCMENISVEAVYEAFQYNYFKNAVPTEIALPYHNIEKLG